MVMNLRTLEELEDLGRELEDILTDGLDRPELDERVGPGLSVLRRLRTRLLQLRLDAATEAPREPIGGPLYPLAELEHPASKDFAALRREGARTLGLGPIHDALRKGHKTR